MKLCVWNEKPPPPPHFDSWFIVIPVKFRNFVGCDRLHLYRKNNGKVKNSMMYLKFFELEIQK